MPTSTKLPVPNAILLISDSNGGKAPERMRGKPIEATPSCIAVGCMADSNGKTDVTIGTPQELGEVADPAFDGELATPSRSVVVWTVAREIILRAPTVHLKTRVRIWVNHPSEPDRVAIVLG